MTNRQELPENLPHFGLNYQIPEGHYGKRQEGQLLAVDHLVMLDAEPANVKRLTVILVMSPNVIGIAADFARRSLKGIVFTKAIESAPAKLFVARVLRFIWHKPKLAISQSKRGVTVNFIFGVAR